MQSSFGCGFDRFACREVPQSMTLFSGDGRRGGGRHYPEGEEGKGERGLETGLTCLDDVAQQPGHRASEGGVHLGLYSHGFLLSVANRCWAQFPRAGKASRLHLAENLLVWAAFKKTIGHI